MTRSVFKVWWWLGDSRLRYSQFKFLLKCFYLKSFPDPCFLRIISMLHQHTCKEQLNRLTCDSISRMPPSCPKDSLRDMKDYSNHQHGLIYPNWPGSFSQDETDTNLPRLISLAYFPKHLNFPITLQSSGIQPPQGPNLNFLHLEPSLILPLTLYYLSLCFWLLVLEILLAHT